MSELAQTIPAGLCQCGCGEPTPISTYSRRSQRRVRGEYVRYVRGHNFRRDDDDHKNYKYVYLGRRHPRADTSGKVRQHVLIAERVLGKPLPAGAVVHHVDGNRLNNANSNLVICQDQSYHMHLHVRMKRIRRGCDPTTGKKLHAYSW